jgi:hypothetical protein
MSRDDWFDGRWETAEDEPSGPTGDQGALWVNDDARGALPPAPRLAAPAPAPHNERPRAAYPEAAEPQPGAAPPARGRSTGQWTSVPPQQGSGRPGQGGAQGGRGGGRYSRYGRRAASSGGENGGRRLEPAGHVLLVLFIGFGLASLLLAPKLASLAKDRPYGFTRNVLVALTKPLTGVSSLLHLDKPDSLVQSALGRGQSQEETGLAHRQHPGHDGGPPPPGPPPGGSPGTSPNSTPAPSASPTWTPSKRDKLALYIAGDSMGMIFGQSLVALCQQTGVIDATLDYYVSSGLSRPDFYNWPKRLRAQMASFDPDVAVAMFGANDYQSVDYQGHVVSIGTAAWTALYHKRVGAAMDILVGKNHRQVWWVGMPIMRPGTYLPHAIETLNAVYKAEAAKRPDVHWVDIYRMFADKNGYYQDYLPGPDGQIELMRQSDGKHFSRAGADMAAAFVLNQIKAYWHIK